MKLWWFMKMPWFSLTAEDSCPRDLPSLKFPYSLENIHWHHCRWVLNLSWICLEICLSRYWGQIWKYNLKLFCFLSHEIGMPIVYYTRRNLYMYIWKKNQTNSDRDRRMPCLFTMPRHSAIWTQNKIHSRGCLWKRSQSLTEEKSLAVFHSGSQTALRKSRVDIFIIKQ